VVHPGRRRQPGEGRRSAHLALTYASAIAPSVDDRPLVIAAQAGDRDALDALLRRHHERLWRVCRRMVGNDADADDALQMALIAIARGIRRFDGRSAFGTWAYRVTTNACLDELRRRRRRPVPDALGADGAEARPEAGLDPVDRVDGRTAPGGRSGDQSDGGIDAVADRLDVDAALARLPDDFRAAVVLRDLCDLDYAEIGHVLGIPPGTVRSRIARGRAQLADLVGNPAPSSDRPTTSR
jgi:RNA polymerase sigma-70 factor (ECF subfamily)